MYTKEELAAMQKQYRFECIFWSTASLIFGVIAIACALHELLASHN